jgi:hypothetical protein
MDEELEESLDRWFEFLEEYSESEYATASPSYLLLPYTTQGVRTPGSPLGFFKGGKREWNKIVK